MYSLIKPYLSERWESYLDFVISAWLSKPFIFTLVGGNIDNVVKLDVTLNVNIVHTPHNSDGKENIRRYVFGQYYIRK